MGAQVMEISIWRGAARTKDSPDRKDSMREPAAVRVGECSKRGRAEGARGPIRKDPQATKGLGFYLLLNNHLKVALTEGSCWPQGGHVPLPGSFPSTHSLDSVPETSRDHVGSRYAGST